MSQIRGSLSTGTVGGFPAPATGGRVVPVVGAEARSHSRAPVPSFRSLVPVAPSRGEGGAPSTAPVAASPVAASPVLVAITDRPRLGRLEARSGAAAYRSAQVLGQDGDRALVHLVL